MVVVAAAAARHCSILSGSGRDLQKIDEQPWPSGKLSILTWGWTRPFKRVFSGKTLVTKLTHWWRWLRSLNFLSRPMLLLLLLEVTLAFLERLLSIADCLILVDNANWLTTTNCCCCCCRHANLCALSRFLLFSKEMLVDSRVRSSPRWTSATMKNDAAAD